MLLRELSRIMSQETEEVGVGGQESNKKKGGLIDGAGRFLGRWEGT